jgi:predicted secreted hydrolase
MSAVLRAALCGALLVMPAAAAPPLPPGNDARGFAQALEVRPLTFPQDHGPHRDFRQEWWYVSGNLAAADGARFGFELTFFRMALQPPAAAAAGASAWRSSEIYMAHFAVTDVARRRFRFAQKLSRAALDLAGAQLLPLRVWIDDWSLTANAPASEWHVHAAEAGYQLDLQLAPQTAPVLNGDAGLSRKSAEPGAASYYYSLPRLAAHGRLLRDGRALEVSGLAWLDREWGSGGLGGTQEGWDWFALQLDDGSALMFYALRDRGGTRDAYSAGTFVPRDGPARPLASADVDIAVSDAWRNANGARYPARWRVRVPALALDVDVQPLLADQELATTPVYWEGAVAARGTRGGAPVSGRGYVELVGYARERRHP